MENLREQIFQATDDFLAVIRQLTQRHTALLFEETFSLLGSKKAAPSAPTAGRARGAKRGADELNQLSERFVQFVRDNPGLRIEQINKQLGTTTAALALPIRKLIAGGVVSVKGEKRSTAYFAGKGSAEPVAPSNGAGKKAKGSANTSAETSAGKSARKRPKKSRAGARSRSKK